MPKRIRLAQLSKLEQSELMFEAAKKIWIDTADEAERIARDIDQGKKANMSGPEALRLFAKIQRQAVTRIPEVMESNRSAVDGR